MRGYRVATMVALSVSLSACAGRIVRPVRRHLPVAGRSAASAQAATAPPTRWLLGSAERPQRLARPRWAGADRRRDALARDPGRGGCGAATAAQAGVLAGPPVASLPITEPQAEAARAAFLLSCPGLMRRTDASGLTQGADWQPACQAAASVPRGQPAISSRVISRRCRSATAARWQPAITSPRLRARAIGARGMRCRSMPGRAT